MAIEARAENGHKNGRSAGGWLLRWVIALLFLAANLAGFTLRAAPGVTASLDRNTVSLGESVTLTIEFDNLNPGATPQLPAIPGITVSGVSQSSQLSFDNAGNNVSKISFSYMLAPSQLGDINIPPMRVAVGGQTYTTSPLTLKVVQSAATPQDVANQTAFLKVVIPKSEIYVGEALPVDMNLYFQDVRDARMPQLQTEGFTVGKVLQQGQTRTRIGAQGYYLVTFKTYVSAVRTGPLTLGPATMQVAIPKPNPRRTIFGDIVDWQQVTLSSEPHPIKVLPIPRTNAPATFNGVVGSFSMTVTAGPTNVAVGDPITVKIAISGQGLLDALNLPPQPAWADFKTYPPNSKVDSTDPFGLTGTKTFEQVVTPQKAELKVLPAFQFS